jgi:hypothetical protein
MAFMPRKDPLSFEELEPSLARSSAAVSVRWR